METTTELMQDSTKTDLNNSYLKGLKNRHLMLLNRKRHHASHTNHHTNSINNNKTHRSNSRTNKYKLNQKLLKKSMKKRLKKRRLNKFNETTSTQLINNSILTYQQQQQQQKQLPILASIELINEKNTKQTHNDLLLNSNNKRPRSSSSPRETVLFRDYVLIPSRTKFKHLIHTVFEQIQLSNKQNYSIIDGFLKIENWTPIRLDSISSIAQCPLSVITSNKKQSTDANQQINDNLKPDTDKSNNIENIIKKINNDSIKNSDTNNNESINNCNNNTSRHTSLESNHSTKSTNTTLSRDRSVCSSSSVASSRRSRRRNSSISSSRCTNDDNDDLNESNNGDNIDGASFNGSDYDNNEEFNYSYNNNNKRFKNDDYITVNDMLSHVISFATLSIKLVLR